jgi:hypothetical protein
VGPNWIEGKYSSRYVAAQYVPGRTVLLYLKHDGYWYSVSARAIDDVPLSRDLEEAKVLGWDLAIEKDGLERLGGARA